MKYELNWIDSKGDKQKQVFKDDQEELAVEAYKILKTATEAWFTVA